VATADIESTNWKNYEFAIRDIQNTR
jgi:hypothetical protein